MSLVLAGSSYFEHMAGVLDVATALLQLVNQVVKMIKIVQTVTVNQKSCQRLAKQWRRMQLPLRNARNLGPSHVSALTATEQLGIETIEFITKFMKSGFIKQIWSEKKDKEKILELGQRLNMLIQELQLGIVIDARRDQQILGQQYDADVHWFNHLMARQAAMLHTLNGLQQSAASDPAARGSNASSNANAASAASG